MSSRSISFLYGDELVSAEFNQRFADLLAGSVLSGYRFKVSATPGYINLIRGSNQSSVVITNKGARIEEFDDVNDVLFIEYNDTPTDRIDSIYAVYVHGDESSLVNYVVIKGYPNGMPVPMMNQELYTFLGYVKVPKNNGTITTECLLPVNIGVNKMDVAGTTTLKGDVLVEGPVQIDRELLAKGGVNFEGEVAFKGRVTSTRQPIDELDVATKGYVDAVVTGLNFKESVIVATIENITLIGPQTIDGVEVLAGERVLVKAQTNPAENGIYIVQNASWTRSTDADNSPSINGSEVKPGMFCWVQKGEENGDTSWVLATDGVIILDTTPLNFVKFSGVKTPLATPQSDGLMSKLDKQRSDGYRHVQMSSSAEWLIQHNLEKYPSVSIVDSANSLVIGDVQYIDTNTVKVKFTAAFSGYAYLS